jgi:hypothetical protein
MPYNNPENWLTATIMSGMVFLGGFVGYIQKVQAGKKFSIAGFLIEMTVSGFVGIIAFLLCRWAGFDQMLTGALVGISAHMGTRALFLIDFKVTQWFKGL